MESIFGHAHLALFHRTRSNPTESIRELEAWPLLCVIAHTCLCVRSIGHLPALVCFKDSDGKAPVCQLAISHCPSLIVTQVTCDCSDACSDESTLSAAAVHGLIHWSSACDHDRMKCRRHGAQSRGRAAQTLCGCNRGSARSNEVSSSAE